MNKYKVTLFSGITEEVEASYFNGDGPNVYFYYKADQGTYTPIEAIAYFTNVVSVTKVEDEAAN